MVAGFSPVQAQSEGKIILGQSAAFTGPAAQLGIQSYAGAKVYFDRSNALGTAGRQTIEIRKLDDGYEPARCVENTQKLIADDVFALFTGAMALRDPFNRYAFHFRASYNDETALIVKQLTTLGLKKIAVFYQNDAYGKAGLNGVVLALGRQSLAPVAQATVERNSVDVAVAVRALVAAGPDTVVQIGAYKACAAFIRAARKAGYGGTFYNVSFVGTQALAGELGKEAAGVVVSQVMPSPYNPARAICCEFDDAVKAAGGGVQANFSSMEGYLAAKVFVEPRVAVGGPGGHRQPVVRRLCGDVFAERPCSVEFRRVVDADRRRTCAHLKSPCGGLWP